MTVRLGERIIAGGGAAKDNVTIQNNELGQIQAVGGINKNDSAGATTVLYNWVGTLQEYQDQQIESLHPEWVCFITDDDGAGATTGLSILDFKWSDRLIDEPRWLRSDTFTWQDGDVYKVAYLHLLNDLYENDVTLYCWSSSSVLNKNVYTKTENPEVNSWTYDENGAQWKTINSVNGNEIDVMGAPVGETGPYVRNVNGDMTIDATIATQRTETIGGITITYYVAPDGHRIVVGDDTNANVIAVSDIYTATGVSWFYILDTTNEKFKLPRTKYDFVGMRNDVGAYVPETLPNHTHTYQRPTTNSNRGSGSHGTAGDNLTTQTSSGASGSTYQNGAPVQQRATEMYLYFYAGEFSQSAMENTAGITTEAMNGKADVSMFQVVTALPQTPEPNTFYFIVAQ